jgi:hypothetical protein
VCALAVAAGAAAASAQTLAPAVIDPASFVEFRLSVAGRDGEWMSANSTISLEAAVSADALPVVSLRGLTLSPPILSCPAPIAPASSVTMVFSGLHVTAAPTVVVLPSALGSGGTLEFAGSGMLTRATGIANYTLVGPQCNTMMNAGGTCSGPYDLGLVLPSASGRVVSGTVAATSSPRSFSFEFFGSTPIATTGSWARLDVHAEITASVPVGATTTCGPDFDTSGVLSVQDIFAFLNAWFAGDPRADYNGAGGLSVQDIFDFLNAWFAGCP